MKICSICKLDKEEINFSYRNKLLNKRYNHCKDCQNKKVKKHYNNNKEYYLNKGKISKLKYHKTNSTNIIEFLEKNPCIDCGENDIIVLQFDHKENKKYNVSQMLSDHPWKNIENEIKKCDVRCANCHTRKTHKQFKNYKSFPSSNDRTNKPSELLNMGLNPMGKKFRSMK